MGETGAGPEPRGLKGNAVSDVTGENVPQHEGGRNTIKVTTYHLTYQVSKAEGEGAPHTTRGQRCPEPEAVHGGARVTRPLGVLRG